MKIHVNVIRVFANRDKKFGNPVGIVTDEKRLLTPEDRLRIAAKLKFSETVYVDNALLGSVSIFNPTSEVRFSGHALIGTSYYLTSTRKQPVLTVQCRAGHVETYAEDDLTWIRVAVGYAPKWIFEELRDARSVENLNPNRMPPKAHTVVWAWVDKAKGMVRARTFAADWGIPEDEANGSGAMLLASRLNQNLEVRHGRGSVIYAKPVSSEYAAVGGRVIADKPLDLVL